MRTKLIKFSQSINDAIISCMLKDKNVIVLGLGTNDPKRVFGTTKKIVEKFGKNRAFDVPLSENSIAGICLGAAISGSRPILTHQRVEFAMLSMDQIVNQISKWRMMTAGVENVPLVIRMIIGRGWGQGPQHSQSLEALFAHIPGLRVVSPSNAVDAKGLMISSIESNDPVIFFEHRWLHDLTGMVPKKHYRQNISKCKVIRKGEDITIVSFSYMIYECLKAGSELKKIGVNSEIIDLVSLRPIDYKKIFDSVKKTKNLLVVDNGYHDYGISSEIIAKVNSKFQNKIKLKMKNIGILSSAIPSSKSLAKYCYINYVDVYNHATNLLGLKNTNKLIFFFNDVPNLDFEGPF